MDDARRCGLLAIGDPHIESRTPGFRRDDYPRVVLDKLRWCLAYARDERLLPVLLGDLFQLPRDNANWLMGELMDLFAEPVLAVYGNHDVSENTISQHDTLSVLVRAGRLRLLDESFAWRGEMNGVNVLLGGTPWGRRLPKKVDPGEHDLAVWIAHHDVMMPGYEEVGRFPPREIAGVDLVINGHIHRRLQDVRKGATCWINPGNITRRKRSDASRAHTPAALRIDIAPAKSPADRWGQQYIEIPHEPFDEVFHPQVMTAEGEAIESQFVAGLAELQARRTATSAGLVEFLEHNRGQFAPAVGDEIMALAQEVTGNGD